MLLPKIPRGQPLGKGVTPLAIVKPFDVIKYIRPGFDPRAVPPIFLQYRRTIGVSCLLMASKILGPNNE